MTGPALSYPVPIVRKDVAHPIDAPKITLRIGDGAGFDSSLLAFPEGHGDLTHGRGATRSLIQAARPCRSEQATTDLPSKAWLHNRPRHAFRQAAAFEVPERVVSAHMASPETAA